VFKREESEHLMTQALKRVQLALSEVKVITRYKDKKIVYEGIANHDAVVRARKVYIEAGEAVGKVRQLLGLTRGEQRPSPKVVRAAELRLDEYRRELERLQALS